MKKVFALFSAILFSVTFAAAQSISFESLTIDYGKIEKAADGHREFKFTNTGTAPLVIESAQGSCGCTVPTFPKEPIMPGASNVIKVKYDTNRVGQFTKNVTLTTNDADASKKTVVLTIKGEVKDVTVTTAPAVIEPAKGQ